MLIHNKDDIEFVTEFPCFLGHPVSDSIMKLSKNKIKTFTNGTVREIMPIMYCIACITMVIKLNNGNALQGGCTP